jgi:hypothetical protein
MMMAIRSLSWPVWPSIAITGARGSHPLMVILLHALAGGWGAGGGVEYIMDGVEIVFHPYTYPTIIYLLKAAGIYVMNNE